VIDRVRELARGALAAMESSRGRIDDLNVYPVPDGDTGTNLLLTVRAVVEAIERSAATDAAQLAKEVTRAALMGARGNSGVILSQIVRGAADVVGEAGDASPATWARALRSASDAAYRAVRQPVEGTMLTAIRELAEEAEDQTSTPELDVFLAAVIRRGEDCVTRTREMLDVLREAGVVDAGAAGLVEILRGIAAAAAGEELPEPPAYEEVGVEAAHQELSRYRYCTGFVIEGEDLDGDAVEAQLEPLGDSLLVVGDRSALKVHVHTDDPGAALSVGVAAGVIGQVEVANMHVQTEEREERILQAVPDLEEEPTAVVAVSSGSGNARLFESFGARVVDGGRTMNPSSGAILAAVDAAPAEEVIVLPNNKNVIMAAEQAAEHAGKPARVLPTRSIQEGLAALVAFDPTRAADDNLSDMEESLEEVATGAVTIASRDVLLDGIDVREGAWLGLANGEAVAGGESFDEVAEAVVERLLSEPRGVLTLLTGEEPPPLDALLAAVEAQHPGVELEVHEGGQPHYPLLLSAE
jgi:DAK2 domain fusion protein YloV